MNNLVIKKEGLIFGLMKTMKRFFLFLFLGLFMGALCSLLLLRHEYARESPPPLSWWQIQSIDTMKYSRDKASEMLLDPGFDAVIDRQLNAIARTGATHVAIGTPYDEKFIPFLRRWVTTARKYNLHVWFRGNFSGWEGWFGYAKISRDDHIKLLTQFLRRHGDLFQNGDLFTPCPECENGGPGDPRQTGDVVGYRLFLTGEYQQSSDAFRQMGKNVSIYDSMNYNVAQVIMDKKTTAQLGGVVTIDHYVASADRLRRDIADIANASGGKVFLGEFGVPIPDINGNMTDTQQSAWIRDALTNLSSLPQLIGVNYWVNEDGSTSIWDNAGAAKPAVLTMTSFFTPNIITGSVKDQYNKLIANAKVRTNLKTVYTDRSGNFYLPTLSTDTELYVSADKYVDNSIKIYNNIKNIEIVIIRPNRSLLQLILDYLHDLIAR